MKQFLGAYNPSIEMYTFIKENYYCSTCAWADSKSFSMFCFARLNNISQALVHELVIASTEAGTMLTSSFEGAPEKDK